MKDRDYLDFLRNYISVGYFDPKLFMIELFSKNGLHNLYPGEINKFAPDIPIESIKSVIRKIPLDILSHELFHYFQSTTTTFGLRLILFWMDIFNSKLSIIKKLAQLKKGNLEYPIAKFVSRHSIKLPEIHGLYGVIVTMMYHYGGWTLSDLGILKHVKKLNDNFYSIDYSLISNVKFKFPVTLYYDNKSLKKRFIALGMNQLREGAARALELIQEKLPIFRKGFGRLHSIDNRIDIKNNPEFNPYYVCNNLYYGILKKSPSCLNGASLEEFITIVDLSLMCDGFIFNWEIYDKYLKTRGEVSYSQEDVRFNLEIPAFENFLHLIDTLRRSYKEIKRIGQNYTQQDIANFQNDVLQESGGSNLKLILDRVIDYIDQKFPKLFNRFIPNKVVQFYYDTFKTMFKWRRDVLHNGAVFIDFLVSDDRIYKWLFTVTPFLSIDNLILSNLKGTSDDVGLGLDMINLRMIDHLTHILLFGNRPCPLNSKLPRSCTLKESEICTRVKFEKIQNPKCLREQMITTIIESLKIKKIRLVL